MNFDINFQYNSLVILTFFFISLGALFLNQITKGDSNREFFSCYRSSIFNPLTYLRLFTHILGHDGWDHFKNNFLIILLIGPSLEEKYGSFNLFIVIMITALVSGIIHCIFKKSSLMGASGIAFMFILLSSFVNIEAGTVPITLILICLFYIVDELKNGLVKKDKVSHLGHCIGAVCGILFGFYFLKYNSFNELWEMFKALF